MEYVRLARSGKHLRVRTCALSRDSARVVGRWSSVASLVDATPIPTRTDPVVGEPAVLLALVVAGPEVRVWIRQLFLGVVSAELAVATVSILGQPHESPFDTDQRSRFSASRRLCRRCQRSATCVACGAPRGASLSVTSSTIAANDSNT